MKPSKIDTQEFREIISRVQTGMTTARDADELRRMMHEAWARNSERAKNVVNLSDRASFKNKPEPEQ